ncbi:MAG: hypothetical protein ACOC04_01445 [Halothece sp.]
MSNSPIFTKNQIVSFIGGVGKITNLQPTTYQTWLYEIEMALGKEPEFGRIGNETKLILEEIDIEKVIQDAR